MRRVQKHSSERDSIALATYQILLTVYAYKLVQENRAVMNVEYKKINSARLVSKNFGLENLKYARETRDFEAMSKNCRFLLCN